MALEVRRIVTGHDTNGKAIIKTHVARTPSKSRPFFPEMSIAPASNNPIKGQPSRPQISSAPSQGCRRAAVAAV